MNQTDRDQMMSMITGYWVSQVVHTSAIFSFADHLATGSATAEEIAEAEGTDPFATYRLLRACASLGLVTHDGGSRFAATALLNTLRKDEPGNLRGLAMTWPAPGHWLPWGHFVDAIKTGHSQTPSTLGASLFEYLTQNAAERAAFNEAMNGLTMAVAEEAAQLIDTKGIHTVVDIGGASGTMLHALLQANAEIHGIVFDLPDVVASASLAAEKLGLEGRVNAVGGDFFASVPAADLYLLKHVLHDWDDASCIRILQNCRSSLRPDGRVAVIEMLLGDIGEPGLPSLFDLTMLVVLAGRERSVEEYRQLFNHAGLRVTNVLQLKGQMVILEAMASA